MGHHHVFHKYFSRVFDNLSRVPLPRVLQTHVFCYQVVNLIKGYDNHVMSRVEGGLRKDHVFLVREGAGEDVVVEGLSKLMQDNAKVKTVVMA